MKIVITAKDNHINADFDKRFARAAWFCIYDTNTHELNFMKNENANTEGHIGNAIVDTIVTLNIQRTISGDYGLNVKNRLDKNNIQMVILPDKPFTIQQIINQLKN